MKKILLICVTSQNVITFRRGLIESLKSEGYDVSVIAFDSKYAHEISEMNVVFYCVDDANRSINPLKILTLKRRYKKIIDAICPNIVFTFMLKPNIFGVMAAKSAGVESIFSMVEGAGDVFINDSLKWKVVRMVVCFLYRLSFRHSKKVFFLNEDDKSEFLSRKLVKEEQCELIRGIGVDVEHFAKKPLKNHKTFLMVARMLRTKGTLEYCECARMVRKKYPEAVFNYLGAEGNITLEDIKSYVDDGSINYLGTTKDVIPYLEDCTCLVLPSYREGCPMSVMEAEAVGRAIITTDSVGCKDTINDGFNGFIVPSCDVQKLAEKCICLINHPEVAENMAVNSRKYAEEHFDSKKINEQILRKVSL